MNKFRLSKYQMRTMPIEQISNRSLRYPKIRSNNIDSCSSAISISEGNQQTALTNITK